MLIKFMDNSDKEYTWNLLSRICQLNNNKASITEILALDSLIRVRTKQIEISQKMAA